MQAAVVISRSLVRPSKGMPDSWRRPSMRPSPFIGAFTAIFRTAVVLPALLKNQVTSAVGLVLRAGTSVVKIVGKFVIPAASLGLLSFIIIKLKNSNISISLPKMKFPSLPSNPVQNVRKRKDYRKKEKLILQHLEQLHNPSLLESIGLIISKISRRKAF